MAFFDIMQVSLSCILKSEDHNVLNHMESPVWGVCFRSPIPAYMTRYNAW